MPRSSSCLHLLVCARFNPSVSSPPGRRCARGSVQRSRGAPRRSSLAAPSPPLTVVGWRTEEWAKVGERPPPTLKPATATSRSVRFPPLRRLRPLPPPPRRRRPRPRPPTAAAAGRSFAQTCLTVQTRAPAASITPTTTATLKVPTRIT